MGISQHAINVIKESNADAVWESDILHYGRETLDEIRHKLLFEGLMLENRLKLLLLITV